GRDAGRVAARLGADAARGLRRRARHVSEGPDEGARELARAHQRRIYLSEETHFRRGDRAPLEGDPARQRQEGDALRPLLSRPRLPAARDVRGRPDLLPENPQARAEPDRGVLRAGARLLVRRRPGVGPWPGRPVRVILAPPRATFDSLTRGRLPGWSEGAAFPEAGTIVLLSDHPSARLSVALRHELAHLALRTRVRRRLPLWFDEGYAAVAAGEWDRLDALRL